MEVDSILLLLLFAVFINMSWSTENAGPENDGPNRSKTDRHNWLAPCYKRKAGRVKRCTILYICVCSDCLFSANDFVL